MYEFLQFTEQKKKYNYTHYYVLIESWLKDGIIVESDSDFNNQLVCAKKKGPETARLCVDYRYTIPIGTTCTIL